MAIYHCSTKPISRSSGRSATASIAYRAGVAIEDQRQGKTFDYSKRYGVLHAELLTPKNINISRSDLWNLAETTETRANSRTAREFVVNIPHELMRQDHKAGIDLVREFSEKLKNDYGVAVDFAIHAPDQEGDNRNYHSHILLTTRKLERLESGKVALTEKSDLEKSNTQLKEQGKLKCQDELKQIRKAWADITNQHLEKANSVHRIDHRSHADRGLKQLPTVKMGWEATKLEREGIKTEVGDQNRLIKKYNFELTVLNNLEGLYKAQQQLDQAEAKYRSPSETPTQQEQPKRPENAPIDVKIMVVRAYRDRLDKLSDEFHKADLSNLSNEINGYQKTAENLLNEIEKHKSNKPFNPFKTKAWAKELENLNHKYENSKTKVDHLKLDYDRLKNKGGSHDYWKKADAKLYSIDPNAYQTVKDFEKQIEENREKSSTGRSEERSQIRTR